MVFVRTPLYTLVGLRSDNPKKEGRVAYIVIGRSFPIATASQHEFPLCSKRIPLLENKVSFPYKTDCQDLVLKYFSIVWIYT